jgi:hypothetical protein
MSVTTTSADETGEISVSYTRYLPPPAGRALASDRRRPPAALSHQIAAARWLSAATLSAGPALRCSDKAGRYAVERLCSSGSTSLW